MKDTSDNLDKSNDYLKSQIVKEIAKSFLFAYKIIDTPCETERIKK